MNHLQLTQLPSQYPITHIIWPEAAVPFFLEQDALHRQQLAAIVPPQGSLFLGGLRYQPAGQNAVAKMWNSLLVLNVQGHITYTYDKSHLVPFGEYIPLRFLWPTIIKKITHGSMDFSPGLGLQTLQVQGLPPFSPLVCYEVIFPNQVVKEGQLKPEWLLNITNDAWYGHTSGPYQHFAIAQVRAIEQGIPLVRAANNGISAVSDGYGRIIHKLSFNEQGVVDFYLPKALAQSTLYAEYGDKIFLLCLIVIGLIGLGDWVRKDLDNL